MKVDKAEIGGDFLKAKFVKENKITELQIVNKESIKFVTFEGKDNKPDVQKIQCEVTYKNQGKEDPSQWTMNQKCRNAIIDAFGEDSDKWIDKVIPINIAGEGEMTHILVDELRIGQ